MAVQSPPYALQNGLHSAALFRQAVASQFFRLGVVGATELNVTAQSTPNMSVQVAAGRAWISGSQVSAPSGFTFTTQAGYFALNDAPVTVTIGTADATNPRIDVVYIAVQDAFYSGSNNQAVLGVVTGTPAPSPTAPAAPANSMVLATVAVAANATSIVTGNIAGTRFSSVPTPQLYTCTSATRPSTTTIWPGFEIFETDTGLPKVWTGSGWVWPKPPGFLGDADGTDGTATTSGVALTLTVTVPVGLPSGSHIRVFGQSMLSVPGGVGAKIAVSGGSGSRNRTFNQAAYLGDSSVEFYDTSLTSGSRTYTLTVGTTISGQVVTYRAPYLSACVV